MLGVSRIYSFEDSIKLRCRHHNVDKMAPSLIPQEEKGAAEMVVRSWSHGWTLGVSEIMGFKMYLLLNKLIINLLLNITPLFRRARNRFSIWEGGKHFKAHLEAIHDKLSSKINPSLLLCIQIIFASGHRRWWRWHFVFGLSVHH